MATVVFDPFIFREQFPNQFPDPPFTDVVLQSYWDTAICYISPSNCLFTEDCLVRAINLMTAHLAFIGQNAAKKPSAGFVESSSMGEISVRTQSYNNKSQLQWFLNSTTYGAQLYALLSAKTAGGFYLGGFNELGSFRRAGGVFIPSS